MIIKEVKDLEMKKKLLLKKIHCCKQILKGLFLETLHGNN